MQEQPHLQRHLWRGRQVRDGAGRLQAQAQPQVGPNGHQPQRSLLRQLRQCTAAEAQSAHAQLWRTVSACTAVAHSQRMHSCGAEAM